MIASFVRGLSTRDVEAALVDALGEQASVSRSTVSRICAQIKTEFEALEPAAARRRHADCRHDKNAVVANRCHLDSPNLNRTSQEETNRLHNRKAANPQRPCAPSAWKRSRRRQQHAKVRRPHRRRPCGQPSTTSTTKRTGRYGHAERQAS